MTPMRRYTLALCLFIATFSMAACEDNTNPPLLAPTDVTFTLADLAEVMFARDIPIEVGEQEDVGYFPVPVRHFTVFDEDVLVFEFVGPNTAEAVASTVSPDGSTVNGRPIDWPATPHFYLSGQVIALYLGDSIDVILAIEQIMGPQFAGGELPFTVVEN